MADVIQQNFKVVNRIAAIQITVFMLALLAAIFMLITVLAINEKKYCVSKPSAIPLKKALKQTLTNKNFLLFIVADFSYFIGVTIITSGLLYFVTVLLQLPESIGNKLMITMASPDNFLMMATGSRACSLRLLAKP